MDANLITALAGVLGSVSGASAAIATTWISQKSQTRRDLAKSETRKRETLYGDFITEASQRLADARLLAESGSSHPTPSWPPQKNAAIALSICTQNRTEKSMSSPRRYTVAIGNFSSA